jgi:hypothetical protein
MACKLLKCLGFVATHLASCVWQPQHVALPEVAVWAHYDHVHHQGQPAQEALQPVSIRSLGGEGAAAAEAQQQSAVIASRQTRQTALQMQ